MYNYDAIGSYERSGYFCQVAGGERGGNGSGDGGLGSVFECMCARVEGATMHTRAHILSLSPTARIRYSTKRDVAASSGAEPADAVGHAPTPAVYFATLLCTIYATPIHTTLLCTHPTPPPNHPTTINPPHRAAARS